MLTRLPIRLRLTLGFAIAMAILLASAGITLHVLLARGLDGEIDRSLELRAQDVRALMVEDDNSLSSDHVIVTKRGEGIAQILSPDGRVLDATKGFQHHPFLSRREVQRALMGSLSIDRRRLPDATDATDTSVRLLAIPIGVGGERLVMVVAAHLRERDATLDHLTLLLVIGGPIALILASLAGYVVATHSFRPIEQMRRRAERISGREHGERLPIPESNDEVRRLGETLNQMLERIDVAMEREREFIADASHELRTPLAILKAELELARRPGRSPAEMRDAIVSAAEETDRLVRLAGDLLVTAQLRRGALPIRREHIVVRDLLQRVKQRFAVHADDAARTIDVRTEGDPVVDADPLYLEQAVGNLIENALRHGRGTIVLRAESDDTTVSIHVQDAGDGFPDHFTPRAFERFTRADTARGRGGAGLGLSIVRAIAEAHGGTAHAANNGGADVGIDLPRSGSPQEH